MTSKNESLDLKNLVVDNVQTVTPIKGFTLKIGDKVVINPKGTYSEQGRCSSGFLIGKVIQNCCFGWDILVEWPDVGGNDDEETELYYEFNDDKWDVIPLWLAKPEIIQGFTE